MRPSPRAARYAGVVAQIANLRHIAGVGRVPSPARGSECRSRDDGKGRFQLASHVGSPDGRAAAGLAENSRAPIAPRIAKRPGAGFTGGVLWNLFSGRPAAPAPEPTTEFIPAGARQVSVRLVRHPRARRYLLRLLPDGTARVTIPRGGSAAAARDFVQRQLPWLERQLLRLQRQPAVATEWTAGKLIWFRGEEAVLQSGEAGWVQLGDERIKTGAAADLRPAVQRHLHRLAARELPPRCWSWRAGMA